MLRDELVEAINNGYAYIPAERLADAILALFRKLVEGNKLFVCGNIDYQNGYNKALDDLLEELK